jgi:SET domain-containing protein
LFMLLSVDGLDLSIRRVVFYAVREIKIGEELCYDYGEGFLSGTAASS